MEGIQRLTNLSIPFHILIMVIPHKSEILSCSFSVSLLVFMHVSFIFFASFCELGSVLACILAILNTLNAFITCFLVYVAWIPTLAF